MAQQPGRSPRRTPWRVLVPVTAVLAGLLFATSAATAQGTDLRSDRRLRLTELIDREAREVAATERRAAELRAEVEAATARATEEDGRAEAAAPDPALELAAGLLPVEGPAVEVSLDDAPRRPGRPALSADPDDLVVHQQDVQSVVNALWAGGAEAMQLMDQRIVSTTAVRCVGNTLLLHGRVYSPPFVITAVGDVQGMQRALDTDPGVAFFRTYVERFGLGYDVVVQDEAELPAYEGTLELPSTRPAE